MLEIKETINDIPDMDIEERIDEDAFIEWLNDLIICHNNMLKLKKFGEYEEISIADYLQLNKSAFDMAVKILDPVITTMVAGCNNEDATFRFNYHGKKFTNYRNGFFKKTDNPYQE